MKATEQKVIRFIKDNDLITNGDKIVIALSGGPDSVFLLHFFNKFKKKYKIEIGAVHINHLLRGKNSDRDELFCKAICKELDIPFFVARFNVKSFAKKKKYSLEVAGRKIRYNYFEEISSSNGYNKIATAHNSDDNSETVLLNLIKGTGIKGIAGIPVKRDKIIRPILCLNKKEILYYLEESKFEFRVDESNLSNDYERNFLRNEIVPLIQNNLNPSFRDNLFNSSLNFQRLNLFIENELEKLGLEINAEKNKSVSFDVSLIKNINEFLVSQLLKNVIDKNFNIQTESADLKKILLTAKKQSGKSEELSSSLIVFKEHGRIIVKKKVFADKTIEQKVRIGETVKIGKKKFSIVEVSKDEIKFGENKNVEFIAADKIKDVFVIRNWKSGDKFQPIGMHGTKKVSDYLTDVKSYSLGRKDQLVLVSKGKIIWLIGKRLDDRFKITQQSKRILKLCLN